MPNQQQSAPNDEGMSVRNWQSLRTIIEGLILSGVVWLAWSTNELTRQVGQALERQANTKEDITYIKAKLETVPDIARTVAESKVRIDEHDRRLLQIESALRK